MIYSKYIKEVHLNKNNKLNNMEYNMLDFVYNLFKFGQSMPLMIKQIRVVLLVLKEYFKY
jgi:hypothetical protein